MNTNVKHRLLWLACLVGASASAQTYKVTDLGSVGRPEMSLNNTSQVTGTSPDNQAFRWENGEIKPLGTLGSTSFGRGINDSGEVVGYSYDWSSMRAAKFAGALPIDLGALPSSFGSYAVAVNNAGQAVGYTYTGLGGYPCVATLWQAGTVTALGSVSSGSSTALAINGSGTIVGISDGRGFIYTLATGMKPLPNPPGCTSSSPEAISESGVIVGSTVPSNYPCASHAAVWAQGTGIDIGLLTVPDQFSSSFAHGVNSSGTIVGDSATPTGTHAFIFASTNGMHDINDFISSSSGWVLTSARAINESGQVLGMGYYQGRQRAYLLTPMPQLRLTVARGQLAFTVTGLSKAWRYTLEGSQDLRTWSELRSFAATGAQTNWLQAPDASVQCGHFRLRF